jgi:formamidopyrimidine-DNA glycosylase
MPELPEVESVRRGLQEHLPGAKILTIESFHLRAVAKDSKAPLQLLEGLRCESVKRRGKYLWFTFECDEHALIAHLGMSGQFRVCEGKNELKEERHPHVRVSLSLRRDRKKFRLDFLDQRTFGWMRVDRIDQSTLVPETIHHVAADPFEDHFDAEAVIARLKRSKSEIKRAILDQSIVSGVGNIYADEALWRAKIHPERRASTLSHAELRLLLSSIRSVMKRALKVGGTSFDHLYVNVNGESGYFATRLAVYGREDENCRRCGAMIKRITFTNRSSHLCPRCQRLH